MRIQGNSICDLGYLTGDAPMPRAEAAACNNAGWMQHELMHTDRFERTGRCKAATMAAPAIQSPELEAPEDAAGCGASGGAGQGGIMQMMAQLIQLLQQLLGMGDGQAASGAPAVGGPPAGCAQGTAGKPDTYPTVPEVGGSAADWQRVHGVIAERTTGTEANRASIDMNGQSPWTQDGKMDERAAVWWAMQKNGDVKYDADDKVFYTTRDGGQRDQNVATLAEVMGAMNQAGGANPNNGAGWNAVGDFINAAVARSRIG